MWAWLRGRPEILVAVLVAVVIAVVAGQRFGDDPAASPAAEPAPGPSAAHSATGADLRLRVERVGAALAEEPVYDDPESERALAAVERRELLDRIRTFDHKVFIAIVPTQREDESGGDALELMRRLHERVGSDGVYVVADAFTGSIDVANYGTLLDSDYLEFDLPEQLPPADEDPEVDDPRIPERLSALLTLLEDAPRTDTPGEPPYQPGRDLAGEDAADEYEPEPLPSVFGADFGPGLAIGALLALVLFGLVVAGFTPLRTRRRRRAAMWVPLPAQRPAGRPAVARGTAAPGAGDFRAPGRRALWRAADEALRSLAQRYATTTGPAQTGADTAVRPGVVRAADCLDAALLAVDGRQGGRQDGRVDRDADPVALVCALVLARAGHAALDGAPQAVNDYRCCETNPLHGPEAAAPDLKQPLCAGCRHASVSVPLAGMRLRLPSAGGPVPYDTVPGPPAAAATGITELIRQVREYAGVPH